MNKWRYKIISFFLILLGLILGAFVYPVPFNQAIYFINQRIVWDIPYIPEIPFRLGLDLQGGIQLLYQADLSDVPEGERSQRMEGLRDLIEQRIDQFGVAEPLVQVKGDDRLIVELAGVVDPIEAMRMIGETPFLEFKELREEQDITPEIEEMVERYNTEARARIEKVLADIRRGANFAEMAIEHSEDPGNAERGGELGRFGRGTMVPDFAEAAFALQESEISEIVETDFGYHIIKKTGYENEAGEIEASHILISKRRSQDFISEWQRTELSGAHFKTARHFSDQITREITIELEFTPEGATIFEQITERNIGQPLAIFLDERAIIDTTGDGQITGEDIYAPVIQEKISGGRAVITGEITLENARQIVSRLRSGALPVPIELISHQSVGPALGMDSLIRSLNAGIWGFLVVIIFVIIFYRLPGFLAALSLLFYAVLVFAIFKSIPVTLTLSGIAGFILSVGMAIDANILTFSRMREEMKSGEGLKEVVDKGFEKSWPSIRDGNLTTMIVAFILFYIGTGFVKGFALTLIIGLLVSLFSSLVVTRYFLKSFVGTVLENKKWLWK